MGKPSRGGPRTEESADHAEERIIYQGRPATIATLSELAVAVLTLGVAWIYFWARAMSSHYKMTTQRIVVEKGLFSKNLEHIDLYRIDDFEIDLPVWQRLLGTGNLILTTTDRSAKGQLKLDRLNTDVRALYEELRTAAEADKVRRGVRNIDHV